MPKNRRKVLYGKIRKYLGPVFHELAEQRGSKIIKGNMVQDHVHMLIQIPPKYSIAEVVGYIKGKSAIAVARQFGNKKKNFNGEKLWACQAPDIRSRESFVVSREESSRTRSQMAL